MALMLVLAGLLVLAPAAMADDTAVPDDAAAATTVEQAAPAEPVTETPVETTAAADVSTGSTDTTGSTDSADSGSTDGSSEPAAETTTEPSAGDKDSGQPACTENCGEEPPCTADCGETPVCTADCAGDTPACTDCESVPLIPQDVPAQCTDSTCVPVAGSGSVPTAVAAGALPFTGIEDIVAPLLLGLVIVIGGVVAWRWAELRESVARAASRRRQELPVFERGTGYTLAARNLEIEGRARRMFTPKVA